MDLRHPSAQRAIPPGIGAAILFFLITSVSATAFSTPDRVLNANQNYYFEFLTFRSSDKARTLLEIFCQVPVANLMPRVYEDRVVVAYDMSITLFNRETWHTSVISHSDSVLALNAEGGESMLKPQLVRFAFMAEPGDYLATVKLGDRHLGTHFSFDHTVEVPDYHFEELQISDLQLSTSITKAEEPSDLVKNDRFITPNVSHIFGPGRRSIYVYNEVYNLAFAKITPQQFEAVYALFDSNGNRVKTVSYKIAKPGTSSAISVAIPIEGLQSGSYELVLTVKDLDNAQIASNSANLIILRPGVNYSQKGLAETLHGFGASVAYTDAKKGDTLAEDERANGTQRWQKGEPITSDAASDIPGPDHGERMTYANKNFLNSNGEGWESDQGRVYLKNGPPSNVDRISKAGGIYEMWEYPGLDRKYLFIDEWGKGQFRLLQTLTPMDAKQSVKLKK